MPHRDPTGHHMSEIRSPVTVSLVCDCGWRHRESRKQNAMARAAKIRAAGRRHLAAIAVIASARALLKAGIQSTQQ